MTSLGRRLIKAANEGVVIARRAKIKRRARELTIHLRMSPSLKRDIMAAAKSAGLSMNELMLICIERGLKRRRYSLEQLVAGITDENRHPETNWGEPCGKEI
jgi:antitoxin MazE